MGCREGRRSATASYERSETVGVAAQRSIAPRRRGYEDRACHMFKQIRDEWSDDHYGEKEA
jgi:hypothetical protein